MSDSKIHKAEFKVTRGGQGSGVRVDLFLYVYEDGHGNLHSGKTNHPVDGPEQAVAAFAQLWRRLRLAAKSHARDQAKSRRV